jgi:soluble lytic murein transglycosylase-like protein
MSRLRWARRAGVSLLAGGGLSGIGLAGPLTAGAPAQDPASGAGAPTGTTVVANSPAVTTAAPPAAGTSAPASSPAGSTVSTTGPSSSPPPVTAAPAAGPTVTAQQSQPDAPSSTPQRPSARRTPAAKPPTTAVASPTAAPAVGPNSVALPPQLLANQFGVLPGGADPALAAQALRFYRIPLFLLPIYQAAAIQYGVPWQVLAAINEVETDYGQDLSVSTAGAVGWMQFLPETWLQYGVDASRAGFADPYNPADAIFAAARYLRAAGATSDLRSAIFAYNHSDTYVSSVLLRARLIASYPEPVMASLTGLAEGRPPVVGGRLPSGGGAPGARPAAHGPRLATITGSRGQAAVAAQDGRVIALGHSHKLGDYLVLRDVYGDSYTYAGLGTLAARYPVAALSAAVPASVPAPAGSTRARDPRPARPASAGVQPPITLAPAAPAAPAAAAPVTQTKVRLFAHAAPVAHPAAAPVAEPPRGMHWAVLRRGSIVTAGTRLGTLHDAHGGGSMRFAVQPAGDPRTVDPGPVLSNWRLLDAAVNPDGPGSGDGLLGMTAGDVFLLSKSELQRQVLADPTISIYACGRRDIASGAIDTRVLAVLAYLSRRGLKPTVSALKCGGITPARGDGADRHAGDGVDITAVNGIAVSGHQGAGSVTDTTIRALLALQGRFAPARIVSLMSYPGARTTQARRDHGDRIHIGFRPQLAVASVLPPGAGKAAAASAARTAPARTAPTPAAPLTQAAWDQLISRLAGIPAPAVPTRPSASAIRDPAGSRPTVTRSLRFPFRSR